MISIIDYTKGKDNSYTETDVYEIVNIEVYPDRITLYYKVGLESIYKQDILLNLSNSFQRGILENFLKSQLNGK